MGILAGAGLLFGASANAQTYLSSSSENPTPWIVGGGPGFNFGFVSAESNMTTRGFQGFKMQVFVGKWFTPSIGARLTLEMGGFSAMGTKSNGNLRGNYGNFLYSANDSYPYVFYFGERPYAHVDLMWNVLNTFMGYDEYRRFSLVPYASAGVLSFRNMAKESYPRFAAGAGLILGWRLTSALDLYLDMAIPATTAYVADDITGISGFMPTQSGIEKLAGLPRLSFGLSYRIGNCSKKKGYAAPVAADVSKDKKISQLEKENRATRNEVGSLAPVADEATVKVYFTIGSSTLDDRAKSSLDKFVENVMSKNDKIYEVVGMADAGTGSASRNQKLSKQRAEKVKNYLIQKGIGAGRLNVVAKGGVTGESAAACRAVEVR